MHKITTKCCLFLVLFGVLSVAAHDEPEDPKSNTSNLTSGAGGPFPAHNVLLLSHLTVSQIGGVSGTVGADIWGWTDSLTGKEYALVNLSNGTAFVDVTDPAIPVYLGDLPSHTGVNVWRDVKVYNDHAFIVADNNGAHGMQVFDLTTLRSITTPPVTFTETAHYGGFSKGHNVVINEDIGFAYVVGSETFSGGLHFVDITNPVSPTPAGGYSGDGYTHDAQVVTYNGVDSAHVGKEIAFCSNTDTLTIVDVTSKTTPLQLSRTGYPDSAYTHQGWLTEDHRYFLSNDELDERDNPSVSFTRTHLWDVADLDAPVFLGFYEAAVASIDHNLYTHNGLVYEGNYSSGMRVLELSDIANGNLNEVAYIDTHPATDSLTSFNGVWSVYPYFDSGTILIGDRNEGLVVVRLITADLELTATVSPDPVAVGQPLTYNATVTNHGQDGGTGVTLTSVLPAGVVFNSATPGQGTCTESSGTVSCTLGSLANGAATSVQVVVTPGSVGLLENTMSVAVMEVDANQTDNQQVLMAQADTDQDSDTIADSADNCTQHANTPQRDTDADGYGNRCDADLNNDLFVNSQDLGLLSAVFFTSDPDADFNGDGFVNSQDLGLMGLLFFQPPGPSALAP